MLKQVFYCALKEYCENFSSSSKVSIHQNQSGLRVLLLSSFNNNLETF